MIHDKLERLARSSVDADIKAGGAAGACRYRFKALPGAESARGGREHFALLVAAYCTAALSGKDVPPLRWFAPAADGEKADYGSDSWDGWGFMESRTGEVWLRSRMPARALVDVVAHECCHALKHRDRPVSIETEAEAIDFAERVAAVWNVPDELMSDLYVVETKSELPCYAQPGSTALCLADLSLHRATHRGIPRAPRWAEYMRFDDAADEGCKQHGRRRRVWSHVEGGRWIGGGVDYV